LINGISWNPHHQDIIKNLKVFSDQHKERVNRLLTDTQQLADELERVKLTHRKARDKVCEGSWEAVTVGAEYA